VLALLAVRVRADVQQAPVPIVPHHHPAGVARQAPARSSWNARAVLEDGLARLIWVRKGLRIDVDHHLVALARGAGIDAVVKGRLRGQPAAVWTCSVSARADRVG
jgi:hypothetical protein